MRLIDADELIAGCKRMIQDSWNSGTAPVSWAEAYAEFINDIETQETVLAYGQWESVEDNPPGNEYDFVLAYKPYLHEMGRSGIIVEHPWFVRMNKTYKYWMPLPEPPKEVQERAETD